MRNPGDIGGVQSGYPQSASILLVVFATTNHPFWGNRVTSTYGKPHMGTSSCQAVGTYQNRNSSHPAAKKGWPVRHQCHADGGHWASLCNPPRLEWFDFWKVLGCLRRRDAARKMLRSMLEVTLTKYMISINGIDMLMLQKNKHARGWAGFVKTE